MVLLVRLNSLRERFFFGMIENNAIFTVGSRFSWFVDHGLAVDFGIFGHHAGLVEQRRGWGVYYLDCNVGDFSS